MNYRSNALKVIILFAALALVACTAGEVKPVDIEASDMCANCKMAISEKQFAAEMITTNDEVLKFDDIKCLMKYRAGHADKVAGSTSFVVDHASGKWIRADKAYFVRSATVKTPMSGNVLAFSDKAKADAEAAASGSEAMQFDKLAFP